MMDTSDSFLSLGLAMAAFFATHSMPALPGVRAKLTRLIGERGYIILHSIMAAGSLIWLLLAVLDAPRVVLWGFHDWARWVPIVSMPISCILLVAGLTSANPFSLGRGRRGFDPARPGIVGLTRHPVLWAAAIWSGSHLFPNGEVRAVLLFGSLFLFSLLGMPLFDRRRSDLAPLRSQIRLSAADLPGLVGRSIAGLLIYAAFLHLHVFLFGFNPLSSLGA